MQNLLDRRFFLGRGAELEAASVLPLSTLTAAKPARDVTYVEDFDELWRTLGERY